MATKSQKISGAVLALAVAAFVVDRWVIGTGEDQAAPTPAPHVAGLASTPSAPAAAASAAAPRSPSVQPTTRPSLASRLTAMSEARRLTVDAVTDAFQPSAAWLAMVAPPAAPAKVEVARPPAAPSTTIWTANDGAR